MSRITTPAVHTCAKGRVEEYALQWGAQREQRVLDVAFAWSVMNSHFDVADFLLDHGADINTTWRQQHGKEKRG